MKKVFNRRSVHPNATAAVGSEQHLELENKSKCVEDIRKNLEVITKKLNQHAREAEGTSSLGSERK